MSLSMNYHPDDAGFFEAFQNVDVKKTGLWVRWLWPDYVEEAVIDRELKALADAGFAGAEIGLHAMAKTWGTDEYWQGLIWAMRSARKYGLKLDFFMTVGTLCLPLDALPVDSDAAEKLLCYFDTPAAVAPGSDGKAVPLRLRVPQKSSTTVNARLVAVSYAAVEAVEDKTCRVSEDNCGILYADSLHLETCNVQSPKTLWQFFGKENEQDLMPYGYRADNHKFDLDVLKEDSDLLNVVVDLPENTGGETQGYIIFAYWEIPSSKTFGGTTQYCCDHYSILGTRAVTDYYDRAVEKFPELGELFREVGRAFFCDSLENYGNWTMKVLDKYTDIFGTSFGKYLFAVADPEWKLRPEMGPPPAADVSDVKKGSPVEAPPRPPFYGQMFSRPDPGKGKVQYTSKNIEKLRNSYYEAMTQCFIDSHILAYQEWADRFDMDIRYQSTYGQKQFMAQVSRYIDMAETESLAYRDEVDGYRGQAGAVHMAKDGSGILSSEQGENYEDQFHTTTWSGDFLWRSNRFYVSGGNQLVYHVFACSKYDTPITHGNGNMVWPGFRPQPNVGDNLQWNRPTMGYMQDYSKYIARTQLLLRSGRAKLDAAIYYHCYNNDQWDFDAFYHDDSLEKAGYSYEFVDPSFFDLEHAVVEEGVFAPEGPGYQAILFQNQRELPLLTARKLLDYAKQGLVLVFAGQMPERNAYFGTDAEDEEIRSIMAQLLKFPNVKQVADCTKWPEALKALSVAPGVDVRGEHIMYAHRQTDDADYYFLYNQEKYFDRQKMWLPLEDIRGEVALRCENPERKPYLLNLWSGEITAVNDAMVQDGYVTLPVNLKGGDTMAIALAGSTWDRGAKPMAAAEVVEVLPLEHWNLTVYSHEPGEKALSGEDLTDTKIAVMEAGDIGKAKSWNLLPGFENISGVGIYTTEIYWDPAEQFSARLDLGAVCDLYRLSVNGVVVPGANPVAPVQDITGYLAEGANEIKVEVASNFFHAEHSRNYLNCNYVERKAYTAWNFGILGQPKLEIARKLHN